MSRTLPLLSFLKRGRSRLSNGSAGTGLDRTLNFLFSAGIGLRRFQRQRASILRPRGGVKISLAGPDRAEHLQGVLPKSFRYLRGRARHSVRAVGLAKIHPICGSLTSAARAERRALPEFDLGNTPSRCALHALAADCFRAAASA